MKNMFVKSLALLGLASALGLSACSSGSGSTSNPSNFPNCTAPGSFAAVYPIPGAANVPDSTQFVYVASSVALGSQYLNAIQSNGGSTQIGTGFSQVPLSQIPTPHANPSFANPIYYATGVGSLSSETTLTMFLTNQAIPNCVPLQYLTFTTQ
jgi:hypothetical protein